MANTGNFIQTSLFIDDGTTSVTLTVPIDSTGAELRTQALTAGIDGDEYTIEQANYSIDNRIIANSATCIPVCLSDLIVDETPCDVVLDNTIGVSWHAKIDSIDTCVSAIASV